MAMGVSSAPALVRGEETVLQTVTLARALNQKATQFAHNHGVSLNEVIAAALYSYLEKDAETPKERSTLVCHFIR